jgi:hypothetical protein
MPLRTRLILASSYLVALVLFDSLSEGRPWLGMLTSGLMIGVMMIAISERRVRRPSEHTTLNTVRSLRP